MGFKSTLILLLLLEIFYQSHGHPNPIVLRDHVAPSSPSRGNQTDPQVIAARPSSQNSTLIVSSIMAALCAIWIVALLIGLCVFKKPLPEKAIDDDRARDSASIDSDDRRRANWDFRGPNIQRKVITHRPKQEKKPHKHHHHHHHQQQQQHQQDAYQQEEQPNVTTLQQMDKVQEIKVPRPLPTHHQPSSLPPIQEEEEVAPSGQEVTPAIADDDSTHARPPRVSLVLPRWTGKRAPSSGDW